MVIIVIKNPKRVIFTAHTVGVGVGMTLSLFGVGVAINVDLALSCLHNVL